MNEQGTAEWDEETELAYMQGQMQKISAFANGLNMPVIIGEYGAVNKENDFNRIIYLSVLNRTAETYNIVTAYWDNGYTGQYGFALFDRNSNMIIESGTELINAIMNK